MNKDTKIDLLNFCLNYPKKLSYEFMCSYCEFRSEGALKFFAQENDISLRRSFLPNKVLQSENL